MATKKSTAVAGGNEAGPQVAGTVELIPLAEIQDDGRNHRIASSPRLKKAWEVRVQALAETMRVDGLLQSILVYRDARGIVQRVFGARRCAAAKALGWEMIQAKVLAAIPTPAEVQRMRATENFERDDLSPAERALALWECVEATRGLMAGGMEGAITTVAAEHGLKPSDVLDACYMVNRLTPKTRELMAAGLINLGQARVLATCGGASQERHAETVAKAADGVDWQGKQTGGSRTISPADIAGWIANAQHSLKVVPWELAENMPTKVKGCGACLGCEYNTATDVTLFGEAAQTDKEGAGYCRLPEGFDAKQALVKKEIEKLVVKGKKLVKEKKVDKEEMASMANVREEVAIFVKAPSAQRALRKELGMNEGKAGEGTEAALKKAKVDPKVEAGAKWEQAYNAWGLTCQRAMEVKLKRDTLARLAWLVLKGADVAFPEFDAYRRGKDGATEVEKAVSAGANRALDLVAKLASGDCTMVTMQAAAELLPWPAKAGYDMDDAVEVGNFGPGLVAAVLKAFGVPLPAPAPVFADFLPKVEPVKAKVPTEASFKAAAMKGGAAKVTNKPGTCRVCGCTEEHACEMGCSWACQDQTLCSACVSTQPLNLKGPQTAADLELRPQNIFDADPLELAEHGSLVKGNAEYIWWVKGVHPFVCVALSMPVNHVTLRRLVPAAKWTMPAALKSAAKLTPEEIARGDFYGLSVKVDMSDTPWVVGEESLQVLIPGLDKVTPKVSKQKNPKV